MFVLYITLYCLDDLQFDVTQELYVVPNSHVDPFQTSANVVQFVVVELVKRYVLIYQVIMDRVQFSNATRQN